MKYAVIYKDAVYVPGDERSRTNPGHGYPGGNHEYNTIQEFNTKEELIEWVTKNGEVYGRNKKYRAIQFYDLVVEKTVSFKVSDATLMNSIKQ